MSLMSSNFVGHLNQRNTVWIIMAKRDIFKKPYHKCLEISREDENLKIKKKKKKRSPFHQQNSHEVSHEKKKKNSYFPLYWLFNGDPYNGSL